MMEQKSFLEISFECGFSSQSHFIKVFKKATGVTPVVFRQILSEKYDDILMSSMVQKDEQEISDLYKISIEELKIYLPILSNFRNLCAHEDILFDHKTQRPIPDTRFHAELNIPKTDGEYIYGKDDIFAVFIMMKYLLEEDEFRLMMKEFEYELEKLDSRIDSIPVEKILDTMGVPKNYIDIIEQMDWRALFDFFYADHLANRYCEEIVLTLKKAFPEQTDAIKAAQEYVFEDYFSNSLTIADYNVPLQSILYRLPNYCGLQLRKLPKILEDNGYTLEKLNNLYYLVN